MGAAFAHGLVIAVMVDEPKAGQFYGGLVAAPVFSEVMAGALRVLGVFGMDRLPQPALDGFLPLGRENFSAADFLHVKAVNGRAFLCAWQDAPACAGAHRAAPILVTGALA